MPPRPARALINVQPYIPFVVNDFCPAPRRLGALVEVFITEITSPAGGLPVFGGEVPLFTLVAQVGDGRPAVITSYINGRFLRFGLGRINAERFPVAAAAAGVVTSRHI
jgi:hypothetical protein